MKLHLNTEVYDATEDQLIESLGLLPMWVREFNLLGYSAGENIVKWMEDRYGFSMPTFKGKVLEDGNYRSEFEEDEDLQWVGKMNTPEGMVYFYPYAITALPNKESYHITRMD